MTPSLLIAGLGPAGLERVPAAMRERLLDPALAVVARTAAHPAVAELAALRPVAGCDDLYETAADFEALYDGVADRVMDAAAGGAAAYVVPGSAVVGERAVAILRRRAEARGMAVELHPGESFLDLALARVGADPLATGLQVLDGRDLPDPLILHLPTVIGQVDRAEVAADVQAVLGRTLPDDTPVTGLVDLGSGDEQVVTVPLRRLGEIPAGPRTSLYLDPPPTGWVGLVVTNRLLREQCPWDARQTHHSLVNHLVEEAYETVEALSTLPPEAPGGEPDYGAYAEVEEELGDLLLQVVFHSTLARETGAFDAEEVAEGIRRKLVDRHPHVFGDADGDLDVVRETWERRKQVEKGRPSILDGVPASLPALARATKFQQRAASVGFDWDRAEPVLDKVAEEVDELRQDLDSPARSADELGDLLFSAVNLARHLGVDPELALRRASDRFSDRFRRVERAAAAQGRAPADMTLLELDALWEAAKEAAGEPGD